MPIDVSEVTEAPEMVEAVTVQRDPGGSWLSGNYVPGAKQTLTFYGVISIDRAKALSMVPQGDFAHGAIIFWTPQQIYTTRKPEGTPGQVSDILVWNNHNYRVLSVSQRPNNGYWRAVGERLEAA